MPVYEYRCGDCGRLSSVLSYSWSNTGNLQCKHCGASNFTKLISGFSFHRSWGDSLDWVPSGETMNDVDEDDAHSLDQYMGRIKEEMGGQVTPDFERMRRELTADP